MYSDVSDKLLHGVVFQVTVSSVHLKCLVANLLSMKKTRCGKHDRKQTIFFKLKFHNIKTHVKALFCGEELGHGAKRNSIRSVLLQRRGSLAHQQARRHQTGGHFGQFELKILQTGVKLTVRPVVKYAFISLKRKKKTVPLTWLLESVSPNCLRTNR